MLAIAAATPLGIDDVRMELGNVLRAAAAIGIDTYTDAVLRSIPFAPLSAKVQHQFYRLQNIKDDHSLPLPSFIAGVIKRCELLLNFLRTADEEYSDLNTCTYSLLAKAKAKALQVKNIASPTKKSGGASPHPAESALESERVRILSEENARLRSMVQELELALAESRAESAALQAQVKLLQEGGAASTGASSEPVRPNPLAALVRESLVRDGEMQRTVLQALMSLTPSLPIPSTLLAYMGSYHGIVDAGRSSTVLTLSDGLVDDGAEEAGAMPATPAAGAVPISSRDVAASISTVRAILGPPSSFPPDEPTTELR
jgi:hypothetical protein